MFGLPAKGSSHECGPGTKFCELSYPTTYKTALSIYNMNSSSKLSEHFKHVPHTQKL